MSTLALKGPYWVTVRQYRRTLWLAGALALGALAVIGGLRVWDLQYPDVYAEGGFAVPADDNHGYEMLHEAMKQFSYATILLPLLIGVLVAGPLVAREFESGTYKLSLTQSIGPAHWLRAKLLTAATAALATALALTAAHRIGWTRVEGTYRLHWADPGPYMSTGTVLFAYVLLAVAAGALVGQLIRRTLAAMAVTGGFVGVVMLVLDAFRWDLRPVRTLTGPARTDAFPLGMPEDGLLVDQGLVAASGKRLSEWSCYPDGQPTGCRDDVGVVSQYLDYHPHSHFWPTQLIETGIVLALAALAAYAAFRVLRARHP